jgi:hypothetical protein
LAELLPDLVKDAVRDMPSRPRALGEVLESMTGSVADRTDCLRAKLDFVE